MAEFYFPRNKQEMWPLWCGPDLGSSSPGKNYLTKQVWLILGPASSGLGLPATFNVIPALVR